MKIKNQDEILNIAVREKIIAEITGAENINRKNKELRKYEIYKDMTKKWVIESLLNEFTPETVIQMQNRASNISVARKIVDKLAQSYVNGVVRTAESEEDTKKIQDLSEELDFNTNAKKFDRYLQLFKNTQVGFLPKRCTYESDQAGRDIYELEMCVFPPYAYDVVEDYSYPEKPMVTILTEFTERNMMIKNYGLQPGSDGRQGMAGTLIPNYQTSGNRVDELIADSPEDAGYCNRTFIWWSDKYHFTTDDKGQIIADLSPEGNLNPIQVKPFVNLAEDQDGQFWALGGDDLVDGAILINVLLTDMYAISNVQGWGQLVISGKNIPSVIQGGPHKAMVFQTAEGEPDPKVQYVSSNPPIEMWLRMIEQTTALVLSSNNLSPRQISAKLDATNAPSGIYLMIENAESTQDVTDRQRYYADEEPEMWEIVKRWIDLYFESSSLTDDLMEIGKLTSSEVNLKFSSAKQILTEKDKVEILKARKDLGIDSMLDLIKMDNPDLTDEEAQAKLKEIMTEKLKQIHTMVANQINQTGGMNEQGTVPVQPV